MFAKIMALMLIALAGVLEMNALPIIERRYGEAYAVITGLLIFAAFAAHIWRGRFATAHHKSASKTA